MNSELQQQQYCAGHPVNTTCNIRRKREARKLNEIMAIQIQNITLRKVSTVFFVQPD